MLSLVLLLITVIIYDVILKKMTYFCTIHLLLCTVGAIEGFFLL